MEGLSSCMTGQVWSAPQSAWGMQQHATVVGETKDMGEQLLRILRIKNTSNYHALCADLHGCRWTALQGTKSICVSVPPQDSKRAAAADAQMASRLDRTQWEVIPGTPTSSIWITSRRLANKDGGRLVAEVDISMVMSNVLARWCS
jgi:hypothetical protein